MKNGKEKWIEDIKTNKKIRSTTLYIANRAISV